MARDSFAIGAWRVRAGQARELELPLTRLVTGAEASLPVRILHGRWDGPTLWLSAAIHGDEVVGIEVIRQVLSALSAKTLRGTLIAIPVVNVLGFLGGSRYLPDRRDLNRSFPGSARGSLASRVAHLMMSEVVDKCDVGVDLHTGSDHRTNLPHIRADLDDPRTLELARAFGAPVILHARLRDGSLRQAARESGAVALVYEGGEAQRFDDFAIEAGVAGVRRVLATLGMIDRLDPPAEPSLLSRGSSWVRAKSSGIVHLDCHLGQHVAQGSRLGGLTNTFGHRLRPIHAHRDGIVIGRTQAPLVNSGDALVHIASIDPEIGSSGNGQR